jgi:D-arabinose 1-dehydrogenase-like Zn-dependent alcohol dehydrogenase
VDGAAGPNIKSYIRLLGPGGKTKYSLLIINISSTYCFLLQKSYNGTGTLCVYGAVAGSNGNINFPYLWFKHLTVRGVCMGSRREFQDMVQFAGKHKIRPVIAGVYRGLENAEEAYKTMR